METNLLFAIYGIACVALLFSLAAWLQVKFLVDELKLQKGMEARREALRREMLSNNKNKGAGKWEKK